MGHTFKSTLQDSLTRWHCLDSHNTLWLPGTNHTGIATQYVVERLLATEGLERRTIGCKAFLQCVRTWKKASGSTIIHQYPLEDESLALMVATTRLETMLGDTAVAVYPDNERYTMPMGKSVSC